MIKSWKEFLKAASDVNETEGFPKTQRGKEALPYLTGNKKAKLRPGEDLMKWRSRAWKQYKKDNGL